MGKPKYRRLGGGCGAWSRNGIKQRKILGIGLESSQGEESKEQ